MALLNPCGLFATTTSMPSPAPGASPTRRSTSAWQDPTTLARPVIPRPSTTPTPPMTPHVTTSRRPTCSPCGARACPAAWTPHATGPLGLQSMVSFCFFLDQHDESFLSDDTFAGAYLNPDLTCLWKHEPRPKGKTAQIIAVASHARGDSFLLLPKA